MQGERLERALAGLERDGLIVRDAERPPAPAVPARSYPERSWIGTDPAPRLPDGSPGLRPSRSGRAPAPRRRRVRVQLAAPAPSLAATTSEQVRQILEAAERSVASSPRRAPPREASDHVARVQAGHRRACSPSSTSWSPSSAACSTALRASGERLTAGLEQLQAGRRRRHRPASNPLPAEPEPAPGLAPDSRRSDDDAGARLIALNMALSGSSREETAAYLAEHFELADPDALLDDVYARAGR